MSVRWDYIEHNRVGHDGRQQHASDVLRKPTPKRLNSMATIVAVEPTGRFMNLMGLTVLTSAIR